MKQQKGMSIVELMLVVLTISILASLAIPSYNDYQRRAKVAEATNLMAGLKMPMVEYYANWGVWPEVEDVKGKTQGIYVESVASGQTDDYFYVEATMRGPDVDLGGKSIRMVYDENNTSWVCTINDVADPIPFYLLPSSCKD